jgi:hypothetical protein
LLEAQGLLAGSHQPDGELFEYFDSEL